MKIRFSDVLAASGSAALGLALALSLSSPRPTLAGGNPQPITLAGQFCRTFTGTPCQGCPDPSSGGDSGCSVPAPMGFAFGIRKDSDDPDDTCIQQGGWNCGARIVDCITQMTQGVCDTQAYCK